MYEAWCIYSNVTIEGKEDLFIEGTNIELPRFEQELMLAIRQSHTVCSKGSPLCVNY